ncbi:hypothetical protein RhiirA4_470400 [Rhizophagus irregularis]|uniref:Uncharacterized protein n=1 Tax=Rhizophagus irregularis TaxID=588596 RepID=A0A2I1H193_9GLOM|nr:hypothetical protein RhiirA4_470400 [Rhizophagus irregularis]
MEQVIPHQQRKFEQIFLAEREKAEWRKAFKREWKDLSKRTVNSQFFDNVHRHHQYPFLDTSLSQNYNLVQLTSQAVTNIEVNENENTQVYEELYDHLIDNMEKSLEILKDQRSKRNFKWIKGIEKNFKPIEKMLSDISLYKQKRTMPRRFKDHSHNTLFFN